MGEENKKLSANLETCRQESKNNYIQDNLWQNSSECHGAYISNLHTARGPAIESPKVQSLKYGYHIDLKELGKAAKAKWAAQKKQALAARAQRDASTTAATLQNMQTSECNAQASTQQFDQADVS